MKILVIRLSSLGDVVLSQAFTGELRRRYPNSEIHFITKPAYVDIVKLYETVDKVIAYDKSLSNHIAIGKQRYDLVFDLHLKLSSYLISLAAYKAKIFRYNKERKKRQRIVSTHAKTGIDSTVRLYLSALVSAGGYTIPATLPHPRLSIIYSKDSTPDDLYAPEQAIIPYEGKLNVALFPGAAHQTKIFPITKLSGIIARTSQQFHFYLLGSQSEKSLCSHLAKAHPLSCTDLCGNYNLRDTVNIIDHADIVISNDSGPMHLAAALGKPQIAFFGATHPSLGFAPLNDRAIIFHEDLACQPCSLHGGERCPRGDFNCMNLISEDKVVQALSRLRTSIS